MEDMNRVNLIGRLTKDADLSYTKSGYARTKLSLAVNRRVKSGEQWGDEVNFFDIISWGKRGESLFPYLKKGQQIGIDGQLKQERWESNGQKKSMVVIEADKIQLVSSKPVSSGAPSIEPQFTDDVPF